MGVIPPPMFESAVCAMRVEVVLCLVVCVRVCLVGAPIGSRREMENGIGFSFDQSEASLCIVGMPSPNHFRYFQGKLATLANQ